MQAHDEWIINLWQKTVGKHDQIYIAGDLTFRKSEDTRRLLEQLPGEKYLAVGNHDGAIKAHSNYFRKVAQIMEITIKPSMYEVLSEELCIVLCHYPLLDWPGKQQGAVMLHGHCHGTMDDFNANSVDLRFDVGIDGALAKHAGGFIDINDRRSNPTTIRKREVLTFNLTYNEIRNNYRPIRDREDGRRYVSVR